MNLDTRSISKALTDAGINRSGLAIGTLQPGEGASLLNWSGFPLKIFGLDPSQNAAAQAVLDANPLPLDYLLQAATNRIAAGYAAAFAAGFDPNGIASIADVTWKLRGADIDKLSKDLGYQQSRIAAAADETARNTLLASNIAIPTTEGPKTLTVAQVVTLYLALGAWARAIEEQFTNKTWTISQATTDAEAIAIVWT